MGVRMVPELSRGRLQDAMQVGNFMDNLSASFSLAYCQGVQDEIFVLTDCKYASVGRAERHSEAT